MEFDGLGEMSPEKDCWWWLAFQHPERKLSSKSCDECSDASGQHCEMHQSPLTILTTNHNAFHSDDHFPSKYVTPGFKPFSFFMEKCTAVLLLTVFTVERERNIYDFTFCVDAVSLQSRK